MKIVLAHDALTQMGGAERVALHIAEAYPNAKLLTSVQAEQQTFEGFKRVAVVTLIRTVKFMNRSDPRWALPLMIFAFRKTKVNSGVLLCSSSGFSHLLRTSGKKIIYCHNPPRWVYQWDDYKVGLGRLGRLVGWSLRPALRALDQLAAKEASHYIANSANVADRIQRVYGRDSVIINPSRGLEPEGEEKPIPGLAPGYLLTVGRSRGYKRTQLLVDAVSEMPDVRLVVTGTEVGAGASNVLGLGRVSDAELRWLYRNAAGVLACSREDFGLTPVESFGFGTPVAATAEGGYLETCVDGVTGSWLDVTSPEQLRASILSFLSREWDRRAIMRHGEKWAPETFAHSLGTFIDEVTAA